MVCLPSIKPGNSLLDSAEAGVELVVQEAGHKPNTLYIYLMVRRLAKDSQVTVSRPFLAFLAFEGEQS